MKRTLLLIGLGIAFIGVSLWVAMSRGRNARAIRAKYRLGGAILSLLAIVSCGPEGGITTCYDVFTGHNNISVSESQQLTELRNGDVLIFKGLCEFPTKATIMLLDKAERELQRKEYMLDAVYQVLDLEFEVEVGDYRGDAILRITYDSDQVGNDITPHSEDTNVVIVD